MNRELVKILKSVRQVVGSQRPPWKAVTASVPNRELVSLKAEYDRQLTRLRMVSERESVKFKTEQEQNLLMEPKDYESLQGPPRQTVKASVLNWDLVRLRLKVQKQGDHSSRQV